MKRIQIITITLLVQFLSGCSTYSAPQSGQIAYIKFEGPASYAYINQTSPKGKMCNSTPLVKRADYKNVAIPADGRLWIKHGFDSRGTMFGRYCGFNYSFVPESGATYISDYRNEGARCSLALKKQLPSGKLVDEASFEKGDGGCW